MNQEQKDFAEGMQAFNLRIRGMGRSPNFYRGWHWAWGNADSKRGEINIFPADPDYNDGYTNTLTDLHHHEHPTNQGDRSLGNLPVGTT